MRKVTALVTAAAATLAVTALATPAQAADGTTTVALSVADGTLAIATTPLAATASSALVGTGRVVTAPLGETTITDTRAGSTGWTLTARTTSFAAVVSVTDLTPVTGGASIPASAAKFSLSAPPTTVLGTVNYTHTSTPSSSGSLAVASASGVNTATVLPVLTIDVPAATPTGAYSGTVTQSVV